MRQENVYDIILIEKQEHKIVNIVWSLGLMYIYSQKVKEESEKVGLKLNIRKTKIMASGPIPSWQIDGETVSDFIFWGSKISADGDYSQEIKRR